MSANLVTKKANKKSIKIADFLPFSIREKFKNIAISHAKIVILEGLLKEILKDPNERFTSQQAFLEHINISRNGTRLVANFLVNHGVCKRKIPNTYSLHGCIFNKNILCEIGVKNDSHGVILFDKSGTFRQNL